MRFGPYNQTPCQASTGRMSRPLHPSARLGGVRSAEASEVLAEEGVDVLVRHDRVES
jgi:hypothetical protein